ncbi:PLAT/LH2 domain-containing protein [Brevibacillus laterosporus]|uniref:PLAT/LH2 domain-containing protein n=1 Tax=Brevibacillus laterosporus TaxID=1465 RepID=UPI0004293E82|nr:PLAT/LH2 domain-containing protein [Brevibacillus laterosporus]
MAAFPEKIGISYDDGYKNTVIIETDSEAGSDTDANISIALYGYKYRTDAIALQGNFEAEDKETFYLFTEKPMDGLSWEKDGWKPAWKVKSVTINGMYYKIDAWMSVNDKGQELIVR